MEEHTCLRCGRCCHYWKEGRLTKCKHLVRLSNNKTLCRIYNKRLGSLLDKVGTREVRCNMREKVPFNYEGCPWNKEGLPELIKSQKLFEETKNDVAQHDK